MRREIDRSRGNLETENWLLHNQFLELAKGRHVEAAAAFALSLSGDHSREQALTEDLANRFPASTQRPVKKNTEKKS